MRLPPAAQIPTRAAGTPYHLFSERIRLVYVIRQILEVLLGLRFHLRIDLGVPYLDIGIQTHENDIPRQSDLIS